VVVLRLLCPTFEFNIICNLVNTCKYLGGDQHDEGIVAYIEPFVILTILVINSVIAVW
jgi:hypothetical protein